MGKQRQKGRIYDKLLSKKQCPFLQAKLSTPSKCRLALLTYNSWGKQIKRQSLGGGGEKEKEPIKTDIKLSPAFVS